MLHDDELLQRFSSDLRLAGKAARTVESYIYAAKRLRRACDEPFCEITEDDLRVYFTDLVDKGFARGTFSINLCGVRFLYKHTLDRSCSGQW